MKVKDLIRMLLEEDINLNDEVILSVKDEETANYSFFHFKNVVPYDDGTVGITGEGKA